jgi:sigma-B regulation protein RsbU (phosphoserine phosphatase)
MPREVPQLRGWRLAIRHTPGAWKGSDFYDFLSLPDGRLMLMLAGGSAQGAPATALAAVLRVTLHSCPLSSGRERLPFCPCQEPALQPPHVLLGHVNQVLAENSLEEQYLTAFCALLEPASETFLYANAGHPWPRVWRATARTVEPLTGPADLPLGLHHTTTYHKRRLELDSGDLLLLASEEIIAARSPWDEAFGAGALDEAMSSAAADGPDAVVDAVMNDLMQFVGRRRPSGDLTMVAVQKCSDVGPIPLL